MNKLQQTVLLSYFCVTPISSSIMTPALPDLANHFTLLTNELDSFMSFFLIGLIISQLVYAPLANRFSIAIALRIGMLVNLFAVLGYLVAISIVNYPLLLMSRILAAAGSGAGLSCTFMLLNTYFPENSFKKSLIISIFSFTFGVAISISLGALCTAFYSWKLCFLLLSLYSYVMYILIDFLKIDECITNGSQEKTTLMAYLSLLKDKRLIGYSFLVGLTSSILYCYLLVAPIYTEMSLKLSPLDYGKWNILNMLTAFLSCILNFKLMNNKQPNQLIKYSLRGILLFLALFFLNEIQMFSNSIYFFSTTSGLFFFSSLLFPNAVFMALSSISNSIAAASIMSFYNLSTAVFTVSIITLLPFSLIISMGLVLLLYLLISWIFFRNINKTQLRNPKALRKK